MKLIDKEKFESCVEMIPECGCWIWTRGMAGPNHYPYGACNIENKTTRAHRAAWMMYVGRIPEGIEVLHRCDTPFCVNPHHLFLGTHSDNMRDAVKKKRSFLNKFNGHKFYGEKNGRALLTNEIVKEIKKSPEKTKIVSEKFQISESVVRKIRSGKSWQHIIP